MTSPNRADLAAYLNMIFGYCDPGEENAAYCIALRGLGEKGTDKEGDFRDIHIVPPIQSSFDIDRIFGHVQRWSQHGRASFIVPACVAPVALSDPHATEDRIIALTTIVVDIDKGNTDEKLAHAVKYIGQPSMVVLSGGTTETDHPKLHAYWRLSEASDAVERIAASRKLLALKVGGDTAFGRSTQVIRLPGSIYNKNNAARPCRIDRANMAEYDLEDILQAIEDMPVCEGIEVDPAKVQGSLLPVIAAASGGLNFSGFKSAKGDLAGEKTDIVDVLNSDIAEGGDHDRSRWSEFSKVAGFHIHQARTGLITLDRAYELTEIWEQAHMLPAWPLARTQAEFKAIVQRDVKEKGLLPATAAPPEDSKPLIEATPNVNGTFRQQPKLSEWSADQWVQGEKPKRKFLVDGLIQAAKSHMLAAEGGAGKTFMLLDLAAKIASHGPGQLQSWCGLPLADDAGGTVVMFTTEDDKDELHIRLSDIVSPDRMQLAKGKLIIIPLINVGGAFALVDRRTQGQASAGAEWNGYLNQLQAIKDLRLVIIDTLNTTLHGEENSATVINEYVQAAAARVCGEFGAALIITHHVRKPGQNVKIFTAEDMKNSIRGSTALIGAFRATLGIWHAPDYKERLTRIGRDAKPGQLYNFAVVKANNPEMAFGLRTLLREPSGLLVDITDKERELIINTRGEASAWLCWAVAYAAEQGHPFTIKQAIKQDGGRNHQMPALIRAPTLSGRRLQDLIEQEIAEGNIVQCNPKGKTTYNHLDVPGGPLAMAIGKDGGSYTLPEGADFKAPNWEHEYAYHAVERRIVKRGKERERTLQTSSNGGAPHPMPEGFVQRCGGLSFSADCSNEINGF